MIGFFRKFLPSSWIEGNPNVVAWGMGDILYCRNCEKTVSTVHHKCSKMTKENVSYEEWMKELNRIATEELDQFEWDPKNSVWREQYYENGDTPRQALYISLDHAM